VGWGGGSGEPFSPQPCIFRHTKESTTPSKKQQNTIKNNIFQTKKETHHLNQDAYTKGEKKGRFANK
jgi:hypothetical protein